MQTTPTTLRVLARPISYDSHVQDDYLIDGPGGPGWARASFDVPLRTTMRVTFANGRTIQIDGTTEDGTLSAWYDEGNDAGELPIHVYPFCAIHGEDASAISDDDIPF